MITVFFNGPVWESIKWFNASGKIESLKTWILSQFSFSVFFLHFVLRAPFCRGRHGYSIICDAIPVANWHRPWRPPLVHLTVTDTCATYQQAAGSIWTTCHGESHTLFIWSPLRDARSRLFMGVTSRTRRRVWRLASAGTALRTPCQRWPDVKPAFCINCVAPSKYKTFV